MSLVSGVFGVFGSFLLDLISQMLEVLPETAGCSAAGEQAGHDHEA